MCRELTYTFELTTEDNQILNFCSIGCLSVWAQSIVLSETQYSALEKESTRKKRSEAMQRFYETQKGIELRKRFRENFLKDNPNKDPKVLKKKSKSLKKFWSSEKGLKLRERYRIEKSKKYSDPEIRERISEACKDFWSSEKGQEIITNRKRGKNGRWR